MRRIVSIWLPRWPIDRLRRAARREKSYACAVPAERTPFALTAASGNAVRLSAVNETAAAQGLYTDMMLTDARGMVPGLITAPADGREDARALTRLARWLTRYSPWTNGDGTDGVLLDVTGCAHLFGGEAGLLADMERRLTDFGFTHRLGLADTPGAAHALARYGSAPLAPPGGTAEALSGLPVESLRLDLETVTLLKRLGLKRIGQLYDIPRAALARRFRSPEKRAAVLDRLDQALGRIDEPLSPPAPVPDHRAGLSLAEPVQEQPAVAHILSRLAEDLCGTLKESGLGAQRFSLDAWRVDGTLARLTVGASRPSHDPRHIERLFAEHLEELDAGFGIDRMMLGAERAAPLTVRQSDLAPDTDGMPADATALARLIDRLAARFGETAVTRLAPNDSHIPERAERAVPAMENGLWDAPHTVTGRCGTRTSVRAMKDAERPCRAARVSCAPGGAHPSPVPASPDGFAGPASPGGRGEENPARPTKTLSPREREGPAPRKRRGRVRGARTSHSGDTIPDCPQNDKTYTDVPDRLSIVSPEWPPRPFLLLERPEPVAVMAQIPDGPPLRFRWRRVVREVARAQGPERIAPEWWLTGNTDDTRDYYRVEDSAGRRYWLYREGLYGGAETPRWFVHGVFG